MEDSKTLSHRTVLLTGAAKRLGKEIALHFAKAGWNVVLHYGRSKDEALDTLAQIKEFGVEAIAVQANLGSEDEVRSLFKTSIERFNRIDCLINGASLFEIRLTQPGRSPCYPVCSCEEYASKFGRTRHLGPRNVLASAPAADTQ